MITNKDAYLTSAEVAELYGFTPDHVRHLINDGKLKAEKLGRNWIIKKKHLKNLKRIRKSSKEIAEHGSY